MTGRSTRRAGGKKVLCAVAVVEFPEKAEDESGEGDGGPEEEDEDTGEALAERGELIDAADFEGW